MEFDKTLMNQGAVFAEREIFGIDRRPAETIEITKGLPTPRGRRAKYPFREMDVGDSFFAPEAPSLASMAARGVTGP